MKNFFLTLIAFLYCIYCYSQTTTYLDAHDNKIFIPKGDISFADKVVKLKLGKFTEIEDGFEGLNPNNCLGTPDWRNKENGGGSITLGCGGSIILEFTDNAIVDVEGPDIFIFEAGVIERSLVSISKDLKYWLDIGEISGGTATVDIKDFVTKNDRFYYIKITDLKDKCRGFYPGVDIDAVAAIGSTDLEINAKDIKTEDEFEIANKSVQVKIWDSAREDGDIVDVKLNGEIILNAERVTKKGVEFEIQLNSGDNVFELRALNEGSMSPNTAAIEILDGIKKHSTILSSKKGKSKSINLKL